MKAILRSNRKVIVDVHPYPQMRKCYLKDASKFPVYIDRKTGAIYHEDELDWVEYYGG